MFFYKNNINLILESSRNDIYSWINYNLIIRSVNPLDLHACVCVCYWVKRKKEKYILLYTLKYILNSSYVFSSTQQKKTTYQWLTPRFT